MRLKAQIPEISHIHKPKYCGQNEEVVDTNHKVNFVFGTLKTVTSYTKH